MKQAHVALLICLTGCTGMRLAQARTAVSEQTGCPEQKLSATTLRRGWYVAGCDTRYYCEVATGPCAEDPTLSQRLTRARAAFAKDTGCPIGDISVSTEPRGFGATGCSRYSVCAGYDGPCMPATPPTCRELAKWHLELCTSDANSEGNYGRDHQNYTASTLGGVVGAISGNITASVRENDALAQCQRQFDASTRACPP